ncbi:hypothetical protein, partial [Mesorhizobium japonicum]|uniref:hypothetical protein n=1 Tax=Mesorhizobium japonicum TaxID=2066070 RepID=UPI003B5C160A
MSRNLPGSPTVSSRLGIVALALSIAAAAGFVIVGVTAGIQSDELSFHSDGGEPWLPHLWASFASGGLALLGLYAVIQGAIAAHQGRGRRAASIAVLLAPAGAVLGFLIY